METMYYIGLDVHKRTISYCVKDGSGKIHAEGAIPSTRFDLDRILLATIDFLVGNTQDSRKNVTFNGEGAYC